MTRVPPPYLRAQSSPTFPPHALDPSPTSSTFIGAPLRQKGRPANSHASSSRTGALPEWASARLFQEQSTPVVIVDERTLEVREINDAARTVLNIHHLATSMLFDGTKNEREIIKEELTGHSIRTEEDKATAATSLFKVDNTSDEPAEELVRHELERLGDLCAARQKRGGWGEGEKTVLLKDQTEWAVEVVVRKFLAHAGPEMDSDEGDGFFTTWGTSPTSGAAGARGDWYEVTLLRPWRDHVAKLPAVRGPLRTQDVLDKVPHVRSELSAASLPNPHIAAPDLDPSILPNLVPSSSYLSSTNSEVPDSPMRRKDSYYSDRTPTIGTAYTSGNLFGNTWSHNPAQRSASGSGKTGASTPTPSAGGSWEYAKPFGASVAEEPEPSSDSPEPASPSGQGDGPESPPNLQERRQDTAVINGKDHFDPGNPFPLAKDHAHLSNLTIPTAALNAANSNATASDSNEPRSDGTTNSSVDSSGQSVASLFDQSSKTNSTAPSSMPDSGSNSREVSPGGETNRKSKISPTAAAALRPGGPAPLLPGRLQGMGISVSSAGIQLSQSTPLDAAPRSKSDPSPPVKTTVTESLSTPVSVPLASPSLTTPTSSTSPLPFAPIPAQTPGIAARLARPHPLSLSRTNLSDSSNASDVSQGTAASFPLGSPRPTALPPVPPKSPNSKPDPTSLLQFSALANLPKTGVIISDPEVSSGYVNALAREILMGVPAVDAATPNSPMSEDLPEEWWSFGHWSVEDEPWSSVSGASGSVNSSTSGPFFSGAASPAAVDRSNPFEAKDLMYSAIIAAGEATDVEKGKGTAGTGLRIGKPIESNRFRTTVAGILARSLCGTEKRKIALRGEKGPSRPSPNLNPLHHGSAAAAGLKSPGGQSNASGSGSAASNGSSRTSSSTQIPAFIAAGGVGAQGRKPYKVFDQSFSQRVIDPFEPLIELCARRGEQAPTMDEEEEDEYDRATNGMIVGIEVEVWEAAADSKSAAERSEMKTGSFVTANVPAMQLRKKRVRRRIIEVTAAPLFAPTRQGTKQHLGGVLLLRDITDDQRRLGIREAPTQIKKKSKGSGETYFKQASLFPRAQYKTAVSDSGRFCRSSTTCLRWSGRRHLEAHTRTSTSFGTNIPDLSRSNPSVSVGNRLSTKVRRDSLLRSDCRRSLDTS